VLFSCRAEKFPHGRRTQIRKLRDQEARSCGIDGLRALCEAGAGKAAESSVDPHSRKKK